MDDSWLGTESLSLLLLEGMEADEIVMALIREISKGSLVIFSMFFHFLFYLFFICSVTTTFCYQCDCFYGTVDR
jgi:hypothetical protein